MQAHTIKLKLILLFSLLTVIPGLKAQSNLPYVDDKPVHFGFSLGLNAMDFAVVPVSADNKVSVSSVIPGFSVGAISDLRLGRYFNLRFTPTLMLSQRALNFVDSSKVDILSVPLYLPVYLKYSAERYGNYRPYVIGGGGFWMDWGRNKDKAVLLKTFDGLLEAGVGCDIYFSFFKLSPELKFAIGVKNMLTPNSQRDETKYPQTDAINKLTTRMITLTFNFE